MNTRVASVFFASAILFPLTGVAQVDPLPGYASSIEVRRAYVLDRALDSARGSDDGTGVSVHGRYLERSIDQEAKRETDGYGTGLAYGWFLGRSTWRLSADYQDLVSDFDLRTGDRGRGDVQTRSLTFALAAEAELANWRIFVQGGYGRSDYDVRRVTVTGRKDADFDGEDYFAVARIDRAFATKGGFTLRPFVGASGSWVELDTAVERAPGPAGADARILFGDDYEETLGFGGISFEIDQGRVSPVLTLAWVESLGSGDFTFDRVDMRSGGARPAEEEEVKTPYDGLGVVDLKLPFSFGHGSTFAPEARFITGDDDTRWRVGATLRFLY